jgi:hypothetical protein
MTNDGDLYVVAILPVSHPDLTKDASISQIDNLNDSGFEPNLMLIDQMIRSIAITNREE